MPGSYSWMKLKAQSMKCKVSAMRFFKRLSMLHMIFVPYVFLPFLT